MNDIILQRITDVELADFCKSYGLDLRQITPHQLRIQELIDFYPKRNRFFVLPTETWHTAQTIHDVRKALAKVIPELKTDESLDELIMTLRGWYENLVQLEYSDYINGQLNMLTSVLKKAMPAEDFDKLTEVKA